MRIRNSVVSMLALAAALGGCSEPMPPLAAACLPMVNVGGTEFTVLGGTADSDDVLPEPVATVSALQAECFDTIEPGQTTTGGSNVLEPGESNFLAAGTKLHAIATFSSSDRLAYRDSEGTWQVLVAVDE